MLQRGLNEQRLVLSEGKRGLIKIDLDQISPLASSKTDLSKTLSPAWSVFSFFSVWPLNGETLGLGRRAMINKPDSHKKASIWIMHKFFTLKCHTKCLTM